MAYISCPFPPKLLQLQFQFPNPKGKTKNKQTNKSLKKIEYKTHVSHKLIPWLCNIITRGRHALKFDLS